jgi:hypothetical protein
MADTFIALGIAILTLLTCYMGVHLAMHSADTPRKKTIYKIAFALCAVGICVLVRIQTHRNTVAQAENANNQRDLLAEMRRIHLQALTRNAPSPTPPPPSPLVTHPSDTKPPSTPKPTVITQTSSGDCSPNMVGNNNSSTCAPPVKLIATQQLQQQMPNGEWLTSFSASSNVLMQTGDLRLLCDGPVLRAGISRINPASLVTGNNGPNPSDPNEVVYQLGPEMMSPGVAVVIGVYSLNPVHVLSGSLGSQVITLAK